MLRQVFEDFLNFPIGDRCPEPVDHFADRPLPAGTIHDHGIHLDVIETVTYDATAAREIAARRLLEPNRFLAGMRETAEQHH